MNGGNGSEKHGETNQSASFSVIWGALLGIILINHG